MQWKRSGTLGDGDARTGREVVRRRAQAARQRQRWLVSGAVSGGPRRDDDGDGTVMMMSGDDACDTARATRGTARATVTAIGRSLWLERGAGRGGVAAAQCTACGRERARAREPHQAPMP